MDISLAVKLTPLITLLTLVESSEYIHEQLPSDSHLIVANGTTNDSIVRIRWNKTIGNVDLYNVYARVNHFIRTSAYNDDKVSIVYNSCLDNEYPLMFCKEAKLTVNGVIENNGTDIPFEVFGRWSNGSWGVKDELLSVTIFVVGSTDSQGYNGYKQLKGSLLMILLLACLKLVLV